MDALSGPKDSSFESTSARQSERADNGTTNKELPTVTASSAPGERVNAGGLDLASIDDETLRKIKQLLDQLPRSVEKTPCGCSNKGGRNLIVCIDGTSNQFGEKNTNVIELYNLIQKGEGDNQHTWYNSGIGTYARPSWKSLSWYKKVLSHKIDLAIAWNFENIVIDAYRWLSETYKDGDCIFLFGFSRGAYQVRTLSAMIDKVGLIHRGNEKQIPFAYQWYADPKSDVKGAKRPSSVGTHSPLPADSGARPIETAKRFKEVFSREVKVHFVGAWDTVSSIGVIRGRKLLPNTIDGMLHVCYFRHALALDERRVKFLPEYTYGGTALKPQKLSDHKDAGDTEDADNAKKAGGEKKAGDSGTEAGDAKNVGDIENSGDREKAEGTEGVHTKEVWFAGTHSDIGGGNVTNTTLDRTRPSLRWMYSEASVAGLRLNPLQLNYKEVKKIIDIHESLTWHWLPLEIMPFRRLTYKTRTSITYRPHVGGARTIQEGQKIHQSVWKSWQLGSDYKPKAIAGLDWEMLRQDDPVGEGTVSIRWKEVDLYDLVETLVKDYTSPDSSANDAEQHRQLEVIKQYANFAEGRRTLVNELIKQLKEDKLKHVSVICNTLVKASKPLFRIIASEPYRDIRLRVLHHMSAEATGSEDHHHIARRFLYEFTNPSDRTILILTGHTGPVSSVVFSPDGTRVVSGSDDKTIRIWNAETGQAVGKPLEEHAGHVNSVVFSPDGACIASGSVDKTIRIWDAETGQPAGKPLEGHTGWVNSVAFSPDGTRIVSGSDDTTIWIWNAETGQVVGKPLEGHTGWVFSVAFSPDGTHIVSGSSDNTIRIWDARTGKAVGKPLEGHFSWVRSVALSPDGMRIVSGSFCRIRIWDAETGQPAGKPLGGHTGWVNSVAFSPDGTRIVSGSDDKTIRIWNAETGQAVGKPLEGHTNFVKSVAFSPNGTRIVSGSKDNTVRIWDVLQEPV
ncbi:WD40 repeat-like protein [Peniophora sp. CONT]|nr:WD40 repeat-like protein [Peniophora sp. CONT]